MMKLSKLHRSAIRQFLTHLFAIAFGVLFTIGTLVPPSQAQTNEPAPVAQRPSPANAIAGNSSFVTAAVNRVGPAVVRIDTEKTITRNVDPFFDDPVFRRFFGEVPRQQQQTGLGSGFIFDRSGLVLTNAHVVDNADRVRVRLKDGRTFDGKVQGVDEVTDLAVVRINAGNDLPVAPLGNSANVQVGDWAIAVGNPLGLDNTVTLGIVSTLRRSSAQVGISNKRLEFIQTDAAINPGNSGGPLVNGNGEVIGINTAIRGDAMGIGFAIPIDRAKNIASQLQRGERVAHPFIGIGMYDITAEEARRANADPNSPLQIAEVNGILVRNVIANSPAASSGIRVGDVIIEVDGKRVTQSEDLLNIVESSRIGQTLQLKVQRNNQTLQISLRTAQLRDIS